MAAVCITARIRTGIGFSIPAKIQTRMARSTVFGAPLFNTALGSHQRSQQFDGYATLGSGYIRAGWGPDGKPGIAGVDDDSDGDVDFLPAPPWWQGEPIPDLDEVGVAGSDDYQFMPNAVFGGLVDELSEVIVDPRISRSNDDIFAPVENAFLQLSNTDNEKTGISSRLAALMPYNFVINNRAQDIRKRFTTESWDLKTFGRTWFGVTAAAESRRSWEFSAVLDANGIGIQNANGQQMYQSPPSFPTATPTTQPFRPALQDLLSVISQNSNGFAFPDGESIYPSSQRALSVNHVLVYPEDVDGDNSLDAGEDTNGNGKLDVGFRPLTPHPSQQRHQ